MILELRVRGLATVQDVTLALGPGLNVLTGETGSGKSMLVDALGLLFGSRADSSAIRPGHARATVEAVIDPVPQAVAAALQDLGIRCANEPLLIRREVSEEGRSRGWIQGTPVTMGSLSSIGESLVDLHGQHETHSLLRSRIQRELLDAYSDAHAATAAVASAADTHAALTAEEAMLRERRREIEQRAEYLEHVVREIAEAKPELGEDEILEVEARKLGRADELLDHLNRLTEVLEGETGSIAAGVREVQRTLSTLERLDPTIAGWRELHETAETNLSELSRAVAEYLDSFQFDPDRARWVEQRRDMLFRLKQKYGGSLEEVLSTLERGREELGALERSDEVLGTLARRRAEAETLLETTAGELTRLRQAGASTLAVEVGGQLLELGFPEGSFEVDLSPLKAIGRTGQEEVTFRVRINAGLEPRPLHVVASGGELSRVMLAVKVALAAQDQIPTLVFDEIDQGIGGEIAGRVGEALARVGENRQVLVVTHLAPIAARAERHLVVAKEEQAGVATSEVRRVDGDDRIGELARMLGDPEAETARRHARTLLTGRPKRSTAKATGRRA